MKKFLVSLGLLLILSTLSLAEGPKIFDFGINTLRGLETEGVFVWKDVDPTIGISWYTDVDYYKNLPDDRNEYIAAYLQMPIVKWDALRINFGVVVPEKTERTRPLFGVSYIIGDEFEAIPDWLPLEVGAYMAMSSYKAYGLQFGLVRIKF